MDLGTVIGVVLGWGVVVASMLYGGSLMMFFNVPSLLIVLGGTFSTVLISQPFRRVIGSFRVALQAVFDQTPSIEETTRTLRDYAQRVRKDDLLSLEKLEIDDPFLSRAVRLAVDGVPVETIRKTLNEQLKSLEERHDMARSLFEFMGMAAPAMGMIGTLIGLVQMLQNLDDPSTIGPAMAVAMLTTLYGALVANLVCIPIADKLKDRTKVESSNMRLIIEGMESIVKGENAMITREKLEGFLAPDQREDLED